jgi:hypothetical protein
MDSPRMSGPQSRTKSAITIGKSTSENYSSLPVAIEPKSREPHCSVLVLRRMILFGLLRNERGSKSKFTIETWPDGKRKSIIEDSFQILEIGNDEITLVAGDADYVPAIEKLKKRGIPVHVVFWNHAAREIKEVATKFINLDPYLDHLCLHPRS